MREGYLDKMNDVKKFLKLFYREDTMLERKRDWMQTFTGKKVKPFLMEPDDICIEDIAHHLSLICRFGGATKVLCSVAQHSVVVASRLVFVEKTSADVALWGLLHDAGEAYTGDMVPPIKLTAITIARAETRILRMIIEKYGLTWPEPDTVREWDNIVGNNEVSVFMEDPSMFAEIPADTPKVYMTPWSSLRAEAVFLETFHSLTTLKSG